MYLSLIFILLVLLLDLSLKDLEELRFQQHLLNGDEDLQNHLKDLTLCKLIPDSIGDEDLIVDEFVPVQIDQVIELIINDFELLSDEFFKEEDVSILVHVVETVDVSTQGATDLPPVRVF